MRTPHIALALAAACLAPTAAHAQDAPSAPAASQEAAWRYLSDRAFDQAQAQNFAEAAALLESALALKPTKLLHMNLASVYQRLGRCDEAREAAAASKTAPNPEGLDPAQAQQALQAFDALLATSCPASVLVACLPTHASVSVNGTPAACFERLPLPPGTHTLTATLGDASQTQTLTLKPDQRTTAVMDLRPRAAPSTPSDAPPSSPRDTSAFAVVGWSSLGLSALSFGLGGLFYAFEQGERSTLTELSQSPGSSRAAYQDALAALEGHQTTKTLFLSAGALTLATGGALLAFDLFAAEDPSDPARAALTVSPDQTVSLRITY